MPLLSCLRQLLHQTCQSWLLLQAVQAGHNHGVTHKGKCGAMPGPTGC